MPVSPSSSGSLRSLFSRVPSLSRVRGGLAAVATLAGLGAAAGVARSETPKPGTPPVTVVAPDKPTTWQDLAIGATFTFDVSSEFSTGAKEKAPAPVRRHWREVWTLVARDATTATIEKASEGRVVRNTLPLVSEDPAPPAAGATVRRDVRHWASNEDLILPLGTLHCAIYEEETTGPTSRSARRDWKHPAYPVPVQVVETSSNQAGAGRNTRTTRTLLSFDAKAGSPR